MDDFPDNPNAQRPGPPDPPAPRGRRPAAHLDLALLSAYLDQELPAADQAAAEAHLATCADCRRELADLRATVSLLRGLPSYAPRRSFQLDPATAGRTKESWWLRLLPALPALRAATVGVAVLLIAVTAGDLIYQESDQAQQERQVSEVGEPADGEDQDAQRAGADIVPTVTGTESAFATSNEAAAPQAGLTGATEDDTFASGAGDAAADAPAEEESALADGDTAAEQAEAPAPAAPAADEMAPVIAQEAPTASPPAPPPPSDGAAAASPPAEAGEADQETATAADDPDRPSVWRLAQVALALALLWLVVGVVGLQRVQRRR